MGMMKYTRWQAGQMTTDSRVGPEAGPDFPESATGFPQTHRQVAQLPITAARDMGRFIARSEIHCCVGSVFDTMRVTSPWARSCHGLRDRQWSVDPPSRVAGDYHNVICVR